MLRMGRNSKEDRGEQLSPDQTTSTASTLPSSATASNASGETRYQGSVQSAPATTRAVTESESLARDIKEGNLSGFVGAGTALTGEANFKSMLRVDGHLSGRISSDTGTLIISAGGQVDADIEVAIALVNGAVNGDIIVTKRLELGRAARVVGNIQAPALIIEQGAIFEGNCRMPQLKTTPEATHREEPLTTHAIGSTDMVVEESEPSNVSQFSDVAS